MRHMRFVIRERSGASSMKRRAASMRATGIAAALILAFGLPATWADAQDPVPPVLPPPQDTIVRPVGPVRPGDVLILKVLGSEGVSGEYIIDNEGVVTIPGIGTVRVANMSPRQARAVLDQEIRRRFANPEVAADFRIRVYVLGAGVANPGPFVVAPG